MRRITCRTGGAYYSTFHPRTRGGGTTPRGLRRTRRFPRTDLPPSPLGKARLSRRDLLEMPRLVELFERACTAEGSRIAATWDGFVDFVTRAQLACNGRRPGQLMHFLCRLERSEVRVKKTLREYVWRLIGRWSKDTRTRLGRLTANPAKSLAECTPPTTRVG